MAFKAGFEGKALEIFKRLLNDSDVKGSGGFQGPWEP